MEHLTINVQRFQDQLRELILSRVQNCQAHNPSFNHTQADFDVLSNLVMQELKTDIFLMLITKKLGLLITQKEFDDEMDRVLEISIRNSITVTSSAQSRRPV